MAGVCGLRGLAACVFVVLLHTVAAAPPPPVFASSSSTSFVQRDKGNLTLDGRPFRFGGCNMYWLGLDENVPPHTVDYPTAFRSEDGIATAAGMGANVVRCHTCGISVGNPLSFEPRLNQFNHTALLPVDRAVALAKQYGIRFIVPLVDNWRYYHGGKHTFTDWRGIKNENEFFTNATVIADFKRYVTQLLTHVNSLTGVAFRDDPTIMAWETGNEIYPPVEWTKDMAAFLKQLAPKQLVVDGHNGVVTDVLPVQDVDIHSQHFYPVVPAELRVDAAVTAAAGKVMIAGEFGWAKGPVTEFLQAAEETHIAGDLYWSLFPHLDTYGFVHHGDQHTLHWPGDEQAMRDAAVLLTKHAWAMRGTHPPSDVSVVKPPLITLVNSTCIAWRGTAMADTYDIQAAPASTGPWTSVCSACATDVDTPWCKLNTTSSGSGAPAKWFKVRGLSSHKSPGPWSDPMSSA